MRRILGTLALGIALLVAPAAQAVAPTPLVGSLHEHSGYSDGWPGSRPATYYRVGQAVRARLHGRVGALRQRGSADRRERLLPRPHGRGAMRARRPGQPARLVPQVGRDARAGARGHHSQLHCVPRIRVDVGPLRPHQRLLLRNDANAKGDGGYATMDAFYSWLTRGAALGGGADGLATFNHPGAKSLSDRTPASTGTTSPTCRPPTTAWSGSRSSTTARTTATFIRRRSTRAGTSARSAPRISATAPTTGAGPAGRRP